MSRFSSFKILKAKKMIYPEKDLLNCEHCVQQYGEYYPPRILLCCQKTMCYKCVQLKIKIKNVNKIYLHFLFLYVNISTNMKFIT